MAEKTDGNDKADHGQPCHEQARHEQARHGQPGEGARLEGAARKGPQTVLPRWGSVVQAGAFGAVLGGVTTGVTEWARVRKGETTTDSAVETVARSSAQTAATMAVASVAGHAVRTSPLFGVLALATAGLGALLVLGNAQTKRRRPSSARPKHSSGSASDSVAPQQPVVGADPDGHTGA